MDRRITAFKGVIRSIFPDSQCYADSMEEYRLSFRSILIPILLGWCSTGIALGNSCAFAKYQPVMHEFGAQGSWAAMARERNQRISACFAEPRECR